MVEALRYKPEGRGFDSRWCHWNFSSTQSFRPRYGRGVDSASNRNEYQEYFLGVKAVGADNLPPSCASTSWDCFTFDHVISSASQLANSKERAKKLCCVTQNTDLTAS